MNKARLFPVILFIVFAVLSTSVHATEVDITPSDIESHAISTRFTNIVLFHNSFDISSFGLASLSSSLLAHSCDKITIHGSLQQLNNGTWTTIRTWTSTTYDISAGLVGSHYVVPSKFYRVVVIGSVYRSGSLLEQATFTSNVLHY